jgi:hypothetical protein
MYPLPGAARKIDRSLKLVMKSYDDIYDQPEVKYFRF